MCSIILWPLHFKSKEYWARSIFPFGVHFVQMQKKPKRNKNKKRKLFSHNLISRFCYVWMKYVYFYTVSLQVNKARRRISSKAKRRHYQNYHDYLPGDLQNILRHKVSIGDEPDPEVNPEKKVRVPAPPRPPATVAFSQPIQQSSSDSNSQWSGNDEFSSVFMFGFVYFLMIVRLGIGISNPWGKSYFCSSAGMSLSWGFPLHQPLCLVQ